MLLLGVGAGLSFPSLMTLAMSGATQSDSGLASGLVNTSLQVGGALGLAVLATLSTTRTETLLADGEGRASALTGGYHLAFIVAAEPGGAGVVIAATTVLQPEPAVEAGGRGGARAAALYEARLPASIASRTSAAVGWGPNPVRHQVAPASIHGAGSVPAGLSTTRS